MSKVGCDGCGYYPHTHLCPDCKEGLSPEERKQLKEVLNYALKAEPDTLLRALGEALVKMNPPIDSDEG
jgi:hypothetical protein